MNCNHTKERKISMFEEIVTKEGLKFNDLEKKIYKFVCMLGCFIIKCILESIKVNTKMVLPQIMWLN